MGGKGLKQVDQVKCDSDICESRDEFECDSVFDYESANEQRYHQRYTLNDSECENLGFTESENTCVNDDLHDHKKRLLELSECTSHLNEKQLDSIFNSSDREISGFTESEMNELFSESCINDNLGESDLFGMKEMYKDNDCEMYVEEPFNFFMSDTPIQCENDESGNACYDSGHILESMTEIKDKNEPQCSNIGFAKLSEVVDLTQGGHCLENKSQNFKSKAISSKLCLIDHLKIKSISSFLTYFLLLIFLINMGDPNLDSVKTNKYEICSAQKVQYIQSNYAMPSINNGSSKSTVKFIKWGYSSLSLVCVIAKIFFYILM